MNTVLVVAIHPDDETLGCEGTLLKHKDNNDISKYFHKKVKIIKIYESELAEHPFPRSLESIEALAKFRGSTSNCKYAESFMLLKEIS